MGAEHRLDVLHAFQELTDCLADLEAAMIADENLIAWVVGQPVALGPQTDYRIAREIAFKAIAQVEYTDDQDPRSILLCPGFIGASRDTLDVAERLNVVKNNFKQAMLSLKAAQISVKDPYLTQNMEALLGHRDKHTSQTLRKLGLARLHLKQSYRLIPILSSSPKKIRWTWANTRAIKRISVAEAEKRLSKRRQDPHVHLQLQKLATLNPKEPLAIVQELAPHLRTNVVFHSPEGEYDRIMIKGPIPLFFEAMPGAPLPDFIPPAEKRGRNQERPIRADVKLEPEPFLPAIRSHRYAVSD